MIHTSGRVTQGADKVWRCVVTIGTQSTDLGGNLTIHGEGFESKKQADV